MDTRGKPTIRAKQCSAQTKTGIPRPAVEGQASLKKQKQEERRSAATVTASRTRSRCRRLAEKDDGQHLGVQARQNKCVRTGSLPLVFVHLALAVGVDDVHALQQRAKLLVLVVLVEHVVELALVDLVQTELRRHPMHARYQLATTKVFVENGRDWTYWTKLSQCTTYSGTSSTASWR